MSQRLAFRTLDKDLGRIGHAEVAQMHAFRPVWRLGLAVLALVGGLLIVMALSGAAPNTLAIGAGLVVAAWLGMAIGANDVANSLGPAVGAGAIGLMPGLILVAVAGVAGAVLAGGAVSERLAKGIVEMAPMTSDLQVPLVMVSALVGAAVWVTLATGISLPVSTSHSIVGGIAGAGIAAFGLSAVAWGTMALIASIWIITPIVAGGIAGGLLILLRLKVIEAPDRAAAAVRWLPPLVGLMVGLFSAYVFMLMDLKLGWLSVVVVGIVPGVIGYLMTLRSVLSELKGRSRKPGIKVLLRPALLMAVVMLGFAHGASDVGNIAGPLSVVLSGRGMSPQIGAVPLAVLIGGGLSIAVGTLLFGRKLVNMVGSGITRLNAARAFCVSLATAVTVLGTAAFGLPASTTHVAVGGVFGVGFAREWLDRRKGRQSQALPADETRRRILVRRSHVVTITAAWVVTLPVTALLGALVCRLMLWVTGV